MLRGKVHKYEIDNIDTDRIIPARHCITVDPEKLAAHCLEDLDAEFASTVKEGEILVVGENFGCGSSRENAPIAIKGAGISAVVAKSFARIFYRNSINIGLPIFESPEAVNEIKTDDIVSLDISTGKIMIESSKKEFSSAPFPKMMQDIIAKGGMVNYLKSKYS
ncbi:MAG: 3-isopropylmalate dehydratase small subunit [Candidatus Marinimicrobia bacterium]|nr:3-isopropylmalate dehydratase small subunit [Candidatus Neomarinimicrobiota bacterium]